MTALFKSCTISFIEFILLSSQIWVSEWLLFNANSAIFSYCHWNDDEVLFILDQHALLDMYSASLLKQQSADRHVAPSGHITLIPNQTVFALSP